VARAAVKAKQAQKAQAQAQATATAKPSRKQRKHASGGNPNQDLFFMRLRRRQKWVFSALGVGSGNGGGLEQLYNSILGNGGDPVAKAQAEIKTDPAKGYKDLANAYVTKNDLPNAITALQSYLKIKKKDSAQWALLGGYEKQQADIYVSQYQQVLEASQIQSPGSIFQPTGTLGTALGTNPIDQYYANVNSALSTPLYQKAVAGYTASLTAYQNSAKYAKGRSARAAAQQAVATAAQLAGQTKVALKAWKRYVALEPNSPNLKQIEAQCKALGGSCVPKSK
jgi:tetratricopeptide (TPR) repeat protein